MSSLFRSTRRCYLIDHHSPQPPDVTLEHMDIGEYAQFFREADIDSLMVYCKDHWGVTYYDSAVPGAQKHAGVRGDWIRTVRDQTARMGIEFVAYYCIEYDEGAARRFPEWRARRADGSPLIRADRYARWSLMCYQTGYREYALSQLAEIVRNYRPDALFLDIFGASLCYCPTCRAKFKARFGYDLPETDDGLAAGRADVTAFLDGNARDFYLELRSRLKAIDPSLAITINFSCHYPKSIRDLLDYQYSEPLMKDNWFSSAYAFDTASGQSPMLAPGEASQVYNYDSPDKYRCDLSSIAAQGCRVGMYSGSQHPDGTLEHEEARRLGGVYRELERLEPYLREPRRRASVAAIIQSDVSKSVGAGPLEADAILRMKRSSPHTQAVLGAMMACEHEKIPYTVLPEGDLAEDTLTAYGLVILPELYVTEPKLVSCLERYVRGGGALILSGKTGLYDAKLQPLSRSAAETLIGGSFRRVHSEYCRNDWSAYLRAENPADFSCLLAKTTPPVSDFFVEYTPGTAETLAHFVLPCTACDETHWVNWWSPPPGADSDIPAVLRSRLGAGQTLYLAYDFFTMAASERYRDTGDSFHDFLSLLGFRPALRNLVGHPDLLRTAFFRTDTALQIHQVSALPGKFSGEAVPLSGGTLESAIPIFRARAVYPTEAELPVTQKDGRWFVALPDLTVQQFILCDTCPASK